jgi:hypothetical protein
MYSKPIIGGLGILLVITSFWVNGDVEIQLYDTYYIIGWGLIVRAIGLLCCLAVALYLLEKRLVHH